MKLKKRGKHVLFCTKWREFVKYYSLSYGSHLVFRYEGSSKFRVLIFDITSAEICYPCKSGGTNGEGEPNLDNNTHPNCPGKRSKLDVDVDDVNLKSQSKPRKKESSSSDGKRVKNGGSENQSSLEIAKNGANRFKPKNPSVTSTIKARQLYVGSEFAAKYLKPKVGMMLQNCNGEQWGVSCISHCGGRAVIIARGWPKFFRDNDLSEGDPCVLELIKRNPVVLKLTVSSLL
ncbi:B3 domain-containing transcription factor VRN1 [Spatholobus suberectus]|nr:B3 domain-containing transcription factor VRN1 [Spatholobus suberectus]